MPPLASSRRRCVVALALSTGLLGLGAPTPANSRSIPHDAHIVSFQSPTRNIGCSFDDQLTRAHHRDMGKWSVRCDIRHHTWHAIDRPSDCHLDYSDGLELWPTGPAQLPCAGDTVLGQGPVLAYGRSITRGNIRCTSEPTEVSCVTRRGPRHGFTISVRRARLF